TPALLCRCGLAMRRVFFAACVLLGVPLFTILLFQPTTATGDPSTGSPYSPVIAPASDEGVQALKRIRVPNGLKIDLFAAEPLLANPVAFCIDERGRFYVAETYRIHAGVEDTREHMGWLDDDLACRTVQDRVAMY